MRWNLRRGFELALFLLFICAVQSDTGGIQPPDHGLPDDKDPDYPSPEMAAFFGARPVTPIPVAKNLTDPVWGVDGKVSPAQPSSGGTWRRTMLLVAGGACGVVGVGLLVAAAAYTVRIRRTAQPTGLPTGLGPGSLDRAARSKSRREVRLGAG